MSTRIADRLNAARRRYFVGRKVEKSLFESALSTDEPAFYVVFVYGPGGIGKTTLLHEFATLAQQVDVDAVYLDTRNTEPTPDAFMASLTQALGGPPLADPRTLLQTRTRRTVLLFDTCETLEPLEGWLRETFLPELPATTLTVMAGRSQPTTAWRADPGWQSLLAVVPLRNLAPDESMAYLNLRTVPELERSGIVAFTHGHPLAISMVADVLDQQPGHHFEPIAAPNIIQALLERLGNEAPSREHRMALEATCLALYMTEALLAVMLDTPDVREHFEWLRALSFIEAGRYGLFPHDLVRETLATDLRWRNPDWYVELHRRARQFYHAHLRQTSGFNQRRILAELIFLHRDSAIESDMATRTAWQFVQHQAPLRAGDQVLYFRYWMDKDTYQGISTTQSRIFLNIIQCYLVTPGLAYSFIPCADAAFYNDVLLYADINRMPSLDFIVDGHFYATYYHDWRTSPPAAWLEIMAEREIVYSSETALPLPAPVVSQPVLVLSEPEFADAVREALRHFTRTDELQANPLVRSRLVVDRVGNEATPVMRAAALRDALAAAIDLLQSSPRQLKLYRALYHTYVQPAATQELAAELLDLPFSTYRRHLKDGIDNVVETLWGKELMKG